MRLALIVEYEGTRFHGFQYQANAPTIQEELEKAIGRLTGRTPRVKAAGRTDAGVHATGQVVAFDTSTRHSAETHVRALNHLLPDEIAVKEAYRVPGDFDPRRSALSRKYTYTIYRGATPSPLIRRTALHLRERLGIRRMRRAARLFVGEHDFRRFAGPLGRREASTVREVFDVRVAERGSVLKIEVEGNAFLPHQVRRMAGALVDLGRGRLSMVQLRTLLEEEPGEVVAHSLPPHGLCLVKVKYAGFPPEPISA